MCRGSGTPAHDGSFSRMVSQGLFPGAVGLRSTQDYSPEPQRKTSGSIAQSTSICLKQAAHEICEQQFTRMFDECLKYARQDSDAKDTSVDQIEFVCDAIYGDNEKVPTAVSDDFVGDAVARCSGRRRR